MEIKQTNISFFLKQQKIPVSYSNKKTTNDENKTQEIDIEKQPIHKISTIRELTKESSPWSEKYRPSDFNHIVLDPLNRQIFQNILEKKKFPHLLFYGPPGVGKTTSAENLIRKYQSIYHKSNKENIILLNASDERGIEVIRTQIHQFVKSKNMFESGFKFVVLDEVDYMTKNAQQALKNLLQSCLNNVRFCLICNYICKIDDSLKNEFICIRFNQLPKDEIHSFIQHIAYQEKIDITDESIESIQKMYHSDIRSMINFIQLHQNESSFQSSLVVDTLWETLHGLFQKGNISELYQWIHQTSLNCNLDIKTIIKHYFNYMIKHQYEYVNCFFLNLVETIMHNYDANIEYILDFFIYQIRSEYENKNKIKN
jgi:replication factor C subunit 3/5